MPIDVWRVIINNLTLNEKPEVQYIKLAFIASVSKQINSICKKHKQQIGIQSTVVRPMEFQHYFAVYGYLNSMVYAHENGCKWSEYTCIFAASNGHLEILKYAHENGCEWNERTCSDAALNGHLECLKYAHENGCPWDRNTCKYAAKNGHLEVLKYAWRWLTTSTRCQVGAALLQRMSTALSAPERVHLRLS